MTCIVGIAKDGVVYLAADSLGADLSTYAVSIRKDPKVFHKGEFVIGYTASFRMGDLLECRFEPPIIEASVPLSKYMKTSFVDALRTTFKDGGFATKTNEQESGGTFMVGIRGHLFVVEGDYQVSEDANNWTAVGSGAQIARGAMFALLKSGQTDLPEILTTALQAAEHCSAYVRGPFHLIASADVLT